MKKLLNILVIVLGVLLLHSCRQSEPIIRVITSEGDMYNSFNSGALQDAITTINRVTDIRQSLLAQDTLQARQLTAKYGWLIDGWQQPLTTMGTVWTIYNLSSKKPLYVVTNRGNDMIAYERMAYDSDKYQKDTANYGTATNYALTMKYTPDSCVLSGTGYVNTDGTADLDFVLERLVWKKSGNTQQISSGNLTLTAYAHSYRETVTYHYTIFSTKVYCNETKRAL